MIPDGSLIQFQLSDSSIASVESANVFSSFNNSWLINDVKLNINQSKSVDLIFTSTLIDPLILFHNNLQTNANYTY